MNRKAKLTQLVEDALWSFMDVQFQLDEAVSKLAVNLEVAAALPPRFRKSKATAVFAYDYLKGLTRRVAAQSHDSFGRRRWVAVPAESGSIRQGWWRRLGSCDADEIRRVIEYRRRTADHLTAVADDLNKVQVVQAAELRRTGKSLTFEQAARRLEASQ